jgi:hypothetical protein
MAQPPAAMQAAFFRLADALQNPSRLVQMLPRAAKIEPANPDF